MTNSLPLFIAEVSSNHGQDLKRAKEFIKVSKETIHLSKTEFDLLIFLIKNKGIVLDRVTMLDEVWGLDVYVEERVVDTNIKVLRRKLGDSGKYIQTVFGIGYKFDNED